MRITCDCDNKREYIALIRQLHEECIDFTATEQKHITEWLNEDDIKECRKPLMMSDYTVVFWYSGKLI